VPSPNGSRRSESIAASAKRTGQSLYERAYDTLLTGVAIVVLLGVVAVVGTVGRNQYGEKIIGVFDLVVSSIPGIGTVYKSFRRMGDVVLSGGTDEFQDVKLVQCFDDNVYVHGFQTGDSPATIEQSTGHAEMVSMCLPLAPNPVTGGFLTYIPREDVYDIDMTVEEGVRRILTSGVAAADGDPNDALGVNMDELRQSARFDDSREAMITTGSEDEDDCDPQR